MITISTPAKGYADTPFGFKWGPVEVERRNASREDRVWIVLKTERGGVAVYVTPRGKYRVYKLKRDGSQGKELK